MLRPRGDSAFGVHLAMRGVALGRDMDHFLHHLVRRSGKTGHHQSHHNGDGQLDNPLDVRRTRHGVLTPL
ncbi:MAG: hypothetical protein JKY37_02105 [Nannocystaceae bacterium]|nr:hypothetical protein [Nannocystaceae bacterium]